MRKAVAFLAAVLLAALSCPGETPAWKAKWISKSQSNGGTASWIAFKKRVVLDRVPDSLPARIAADTKYWLWINGEPAVFEGGLKRGPSPGDGYYDVFDLAPFLREGENCISILINHLGKNSFSHLDSGIPALLFEAIGDGVEILSDSSWEASVQRGYGVAPGPVPNYRLSESNIRYNAAAFPWEWYRPDFRKFIGKALELGFVPGEPPLGKLVERPVPLWKFSAPTAYVSVERHSDTLVCTLPYNCQFTPILEVEAPKGKVIRMETDHRKVGTEECVRAEYVTREGLQRYESLGWMNGEKMYYTIPSGVTVKEVAYRESGYDTSVGGSFSCDDPMLNEYWQKAARTLLVCMRDSWYDCPDRERAQWWGDEVNELEAAFYALSPSAHALAVKGALELAAWAKPDGVLHAPVPTGNYFTELPMQMLASVGWYGFARLAFYGGDYSFVPKVYPAVHRYLHQVWQTGGDGLPIYRKGGWDWPDAGENRDREGQLPLWYYLALKGEREMALSLGLTADAAEDEEMMERVKTAFNRSFWDGNAYRSPDWKDGPDDRVQALAVVSGIAPPEYYPALTKVLTTQKFSTTYSLKYVLEAFCLMGRSDLALDRMREMYPTIMKEGCSTLYEHWNYEGSSNHAWGGSGISILGEYFAGITPLEPGFKAFRVAPQPAALSHIDCSIDSPSGLIRLTLNRKGKKLELTLTVPEGTRAEVPLPKGGTLTLTGGTHKIKL